MINFYSSSQDSKVRFRDTDKHIRLPYSGQNKWQYIATLGGISSSGSHRKRNERVLRGGRRSDEPGAEPPDRVVTCSPTRWWLVQLRLSTADRHPQRCRYTRGRARCYNYQLSALERSNKSAIPLRSTFNESSWLNFRRLSYSETSSWKVYFFPSFSRSLLNIVWVSLIESFILRLIVRPQINIKYSALISICILLKIIKLRN